MTTSSLHARIIAPVLAIAVLTSAAITATADAQDIAAVRRAVVSAEHGSAIFVIDTMGTTSGRNILEITRIKDSGSVVGFYYVEGASRPARANVMGTVSILRSTAALGRNGIKILFTASSAPIPLLGRGGIVNTTAFEGALWIGSTPSATFMAGTFTISGLGVRGPYPFCAKLESIPG